MTEKEFYTLIADTADEMAKERGYVKPLCPFCHPVAVLHRHPHVSRVLFHASIFLPVVTACIALDKAPVFATMELSVTLIAHTYAIVLNIVKGKAE